MFQHFKNIEGAFRHIRWFSIAFLAGNIVICVYNTYTSQMALQSSMGVVYVLSGDNLLPARQQNRTETLPIELRAHIRNFHNYFYNLEPDDAQIRTSINRSLYLADESAKRAFDNLSESNYYGNLIAGNISQQLQEADSIVLDTRTVPYHFLYYGKLKLVRATSVVTRSLVTEGYLRQSQISDKNEHGYLIERWNVLQNADLTVEKR
jgi:conjugative transposon TraK protein